MENSICRFMPTKNYTGDLKTIHFVYESEFATLSQPFFYPYYCMHLVTAGTAVLRVEGKTYPLSRGSVFFAFPGVSYEIDGTEKLKYIYISFLGSGVATVMESMDISPQSPVHYGFAHIIEFWQTSILRVDQKNANLLAESVLLYTLSFFSNREGDASNGGSGNLVELIVDYIDNHYTEPDISVKKVADVFSYTEKYLSHLFKKRMNIGFSTYINSRRIQHAKELIAQRNRSVSQIALLCGYTDALYFSKVFRKNTGISPTQYIKNR